MKIIGRLALFLICIFMVESASATVNITTSRIQYSCNGSTTVFAYPFKVFEDDDLEVIATDTVPSEDTLILNTDYTVSGAGDDSGGNVTLTAGSNCPNNYTLTILRNIDITQDTDYSDGQTLTADGLESPPDKSRIIDQQFNENLDRSLKIIKSSTLTDLTVIPGADKAIFFNSSGTGLVARELGSSTLAVPADESIIADMINTVGIPATLTKLSVYTKAETLSAALTLENKKLVDDSTSIVDDADNTKQVKFQCSGITTATTRTLTVPDKTSTIVVQDAGQIDSPILTGDVSGSAFQDDDAFASASATKFASSESIKAYVDNTLAPISIKAWVHFTVSGGTVTLQDSFNISSIGDNGAGDFTANFTSPFANATYAMAGWAEGGASTEFFVTGNSGDTMTTSAKQFKVASGGGALNDPTKCTVMFIGD